MDNINSPVYARNYGFWNEEEQSALLNANVAIGGVGGDGFQLGLKLARMGVSTFDIADPEVFEPENANRVPGANNDTYGLLKADVFEAEVRKINPDADIRIYKDGVTEENVEEFLSRATIAFDETELTYLNIGTALAREARKRKIPDVMVMNVGFAAQVTSFDPMSKYTFEKMMGVPKDMPLDEVKDLSVDFSRCLPYIPEYTDLSTLEAVKEGASLPSIGIGVDVASALGASEAFKHIVPSGRNNRMKPTWAPRIRWTDAYSGVSNTTMFPRVSHNKHLAKAILNNVIGNYSKASYRDNERNARLTD